MKQKSEGQKDVNPVGQATMPSRQPIRSQHRAKLAVIYIRRSTSDRPTDVTGSRRALAEFPRRWGWSESAITIIEDLGFPGTESTDRPGFQQLLARMDRGEVGLVLVRDPSRLSRNYLELALFSIKAIRNSVLIAVNGRVYTPSARTLCRLFGLRFPLTLSRTKDPLRAVMSQGAHDSCRGRARARNGGTR